MARVKDPVCGMEVDPAAAAGKSSYGSETYHFCSRGCQRQFEDEPSKYVAKSATRGASTAAAGPPHEKMERHEPPRTTRGPVTAPKFGSAGSGGAELEPLPEAHDKPKPRR